MSQNDHAVKPWVCFSHGKESGPNGTKIAALAAAATAHGWQTASLDYRGVDDPNERVAMLAAWCAAMTAPFVLVGSSMGGHVAAAAAAQTDNQARGLFLLAPAFFMPGYEHYTPAPPGCPVAIVHGWHDTVVPWQHSARFAAPAGARLVLLNDEHRLVSALDDVVVEFVRFLGEVGLA